MVLRRERERVIRAILSGDDLVRVDQRTDTLLGGQA